MAAKLNLGKSESEPVPVVQTLTHQQLAAERETKINPVEPTAVVNQQTVLAGERVRKNYPASAEYQRTLSLSAEDAAALEALEAEVDNLPVAKGQWRAPDGRVFIRASITSIEIPHFSKVRSTDRIRIWQGASFTDVMVDDPVEAMRELT